MSVTVFITVDAGSLGRLPRLINVAAITSVEHRFVAGHADAKPVGTTIHTMGPDIVCNEPYHVVEELIRKATIAALELEASFATV